MSDLLSPVTRISLENQPARRVSLSQGNLKGPLGPQIKQKSSICKYHQFEGPRKHLEPNPTLYNSLIKNSAKESIDQPWLKLEILILQDVSQAADLLPSAVGGGDVPAELGEVDGARVPEGDVGVDVHARGLDQLGHRLAALAGVADLDQHLVVEQALQTLCKGKSIDRNIPTFMRRRMYPRSCLRA